MSSNFLMGDVNLSLSKYTSNGTDTSSEDGHSMVRDAIAKKLFDELLFSTRKEERCAGTVWLLSITMYCGHHPAIQKILPEIQVCNIVVFFFLLLTFLFVELTSNCLFGEELVDIFDSSLAVRAKTTFDLKL